MTPAGGATAGPVQTLRTLVCFTPCTFAASGFCAFKSGPKFEGIMICLRTSLSQNPQRLIGSRRSASRRPGLGFAFSAGPSLEPGPCWRAAQTGAHLPGPRGTRSSTHMRLGSFLVHAVGLGSPWGPSGVPTSGERIAGPPWLLEFSTGSPFTRTFDKTACQRRSPHTHPGLQGSLAG